MKVTVIPIVVGEFETKTRGIVNIGENTQKSPGNLKKLAVTQIPVKAGVKNLQRVFTLGKFFTPAFT